MKQIVSIWIVILSLNLFAEVPSDDSISLTDVAKNANEWKLQNMISEKLEDGIWFLRIQQYPYFMFSPKISINADNIKKISFKMKLPRNVNLVGNILFIRSGEAWSDKRMVTFKCRNDGERYEYKVDMGKNSLWNGTITQIRLCPMSIPAALMPNWSTRKSTVELGPEFDGDIKPFVWRWKKYGISKSYDKCSIPIPYKKDNWKIIDFKNNMKKANRKAKVVFLGDSITDLWEFHPKYQNGAKIWKQFYVPMNVENFAISGDKTENILWQLTDGNMLHDMNPELVVMMIGINNVMRGDNPRSISKGIKNILKVLQKSYPEAKILLLSLLPNCMKWDKTKRIYTDSRNVNSIIKSFADNKKVFFLDTSKEFIDSNGEVDSSNFYDGLHLTEKGFQAWDKALRPKITELLNK